MTALRPLLFVPLALGVLACGPADTPPATFSEVNTRVFTLSCVFSACHQGPSAAGDMNLQVMAYEHIVDAASMENPSKVRVKPGDPDGSYLMDKLLGPGVTGDQMPQGDMLDEERLALVRSWIEAGAPND